MAMAKQVRAILPWILLLARGAAVSAFATPPKSRTRDGTSSALGRVIHHGPGHRRQPDRKALSMVAAATLPRISPDDVAALSAQGYVVIPDFLPRGLVDELRADVDALRAASAFKVARIGQDSTNELNTDIRVAETCFLGRNRPELTSVSSAGGADSVRDRGGGVYDIVLDALCDSLSELSMTESQQRLDKSLNELLYAYYPRGGYYRRHRDAVPNSASVLRKYSLLLYLNKEGWDPDVDAGQLRLHFDGGGDDCPPGVEPKFLDVDPHGGTLVLFKSDMVPHEVLNTSSERYALVGWFNRGVTAGDIGSLGEAGGEGDIMRLGMMVASLALVTFGVVSLF